MGISTSHKLHMHSGSDYICLNCDKYVHHMQNHDVHSEPLPAKLSNASRQPLIVSVVTVVVLDTATKFLSQYDYACKVKRYVGRGTNFLGTCVVNAILSLNFHHIYMHTQTMIQDSPPSFRYTPTNDDRPPNPNHRHSKSWFTYAFVLVYI